MKSFTTVQIITSNTFSVFLGDFKEIEHTLYTDEKQRAGKSAWPKPHKYACVRACRRTPSYVKPILLSWPIFPALLRGKGARGPTLKRL